MADVEKGVVGGMKLPNQECPDVAFATPSFTHSVCKRYNRSMIQTMWLLHQRGLTAGQMDRDGDCFVAKARNKMFWDFLIEYPMTQNFFFIDDDIGWEPHKVIDFLQRPEDVICGIYPKKSPELDFPCTLAVEDGKLVEKNGLYLAILAPAGFMRIKRHVIEKLCQLAPTFSDWEPDGQLKEYPLVFEAGRGDNGLWWGEDYTFGRKWQSIGGEIWVDPNAKFSHQGLNNWENSLAENLWLFRDKAAATKNPTAPATPQEALSMADDIERLLDAAE
jgi:hypothetical protein